MMNEERKSLTLLEFMNYLRYPTSIVNVMDGNGNTIKTFDSSNYDEFQTYQECEVSTIKSKCELVKENHFGLREMLVSFSSTILIFVWEKGEKEHEIHL